MIQKLVLLFALSGMIFTNLPNAGPGAGQYEIRITFSGLKPANCPVFIGVYDSADKFLSEHRFRGISVTSGGKSEFTTTISLPEGTFALAVFQDINANEKLDKNFFGIPSEPYGFSNNAMGSFGPPSWEAAAFTVDGSAKIAISMRD